MVLLSPSCLASAQRQDAAALVDIHYAAVHQTVALFYEPAILPGWSPTPTPTRIERLECMLTASGGTWLVVKLAQVAGFSVLLLAEQLLRGLYVHLAVERQGLGSQLLWAFEQIAVRQGVRRLHVHSALNAVSFYQQRGYQGVAARQHCLPSGQFMYCLDMYKSFGNVGDRSLRQP